jgi:superfamily II RNA helicase
LTNKIDLSKKNGYLDPDIENVGVVIMDEVHYILDKHRGHVWERAIMDLPYNIQLVALSATLSDPIRLSEWMSQRRPTKLVTRSDRHVPLYLGIYNRPSVLLNGMVTNHSLYIN